MEVPDGIPKWSGHKGQSELMQEMSAEEGYVHTRFGSARALADTSFHSTMPKYKGKGGIPQQEKWNDDPEKRAGL